MTATTEKPRHRSLKIYPGCYKYRGYYLQSGRFLNNGRNEWQVRHGKDGIDLVSYAVNLKAAKAFVDLIESI